jgi:putative transposase
MLKAFKYKLTPTLSQIDLLNQHFGSVRLVYNMALAYKKSQYKDCGISVSIYEVKKLLPVWKKTEGLDFLKEVNSLSLQQSILNLDKSYQRFFKKQGGFPKFKSKKTSKPSFTIPQNTEVNFESGLVTIPKFKSGIKCNFHRHFNGDIKSSTISQLPNGKYEISILVNTRDEQGNELEYPKPLEINTIAENQVVGIDLGLKDFLITSDNAKVGNPIFLRRSLKRLQRMSKRHSKRTKIATKVFEYSIDNTNINNSNNPPTPILTKTGKHKYHLDLSKNSKKSQRRLTLLHYKVSCQRKDFLHQQSKRLAYGTTSINGVSIPNSYSSFNCFAVETLRVKNMQKNRKLSRAISDVSWSSFITMLEYKLKWNSKHISRVDTFYPSSKLCSVCNHKNTELLLSHRIWICKSCNTIHDRDINAATNIKNQGYMLLLQSDISNRKDLKSYSSTGSKEPRRKTVRSTV